MNCHFFISLAVLAGTIFPAGAAELSPAELKEAGKLYVAKCAKCHEFHDPMAYSDAVWSDWMVKMAKKSKLKEKQADLMGRYTDEIRAGRAAVSRK